MNKDQGDIEVPIIIQNVLSPNHDGSVGSFEWVCWVVSPLIGGVNLNKDVNMDKTWSVADDNMEELTVPQSQPSQMICNQQAQWT